MTASFQITLPPCGALLGLRVDDEPRDGSLLLVFSEGAERSVAATVALGASSR